MTDIDIELATGMRLPGEREIMNPDNHPPVAVPMVPVPPPDNERWRRFLDGELTLAGFTTTTANRVAALEAELVLVKGENGELRAALNEARDLLVPFAVIGGNQDQQNAYDFLLEQSVVRQTAV